MNRPTPLNRLKHMQRLEILARHSRLSFEKMGRILEMQPHSVDQLISFARALPWVSVDKAAEGYLIRIDCELREICEGLRPRPSILPDGISIVSFLRELRQEIADRRKSNKDERGRARWNPEAIVTQFQTDLLNWIEERLDIVQVAIDAKAPNGRSGKQTPHSGKDGGDHEFQKSKG